jgi:hypothetical protein
MKRFCLRGVCSLFQTGLMIAWITAAPSALAGEKYYISIFGSESSPKLPRYTHTWATFVRATGEGEDHSQYAIESCTISWLPASLKVRPLRLCAEPGVNFDLHATFDYALGQEQLISEWGPFQIPQSLYEGALEQKAHLESGAVRYKAVDPNFGPRVTTVSNCIHAVTDIDPDFGRLYYWELRRFGKEASHFAAHQVLHRSPEVDPEENLDWIEERLGLHEYPIIHRPLPYHRLFVFDR